MTHLLWHRSTRSERPCERGTDRASLHGRRGRTTGSQTMDMTNDIGEFLTSRRARITPEQVGLPTYGKRRVPGLRREEVASLAGVSVEYYKRLERGNASRASKSVLEAPPPAPRPDDSARA